MHVADRAFASLALGLALSACSEAGPGNTANNAAMTEIEALPPDESAATPTDELVDGAAEPSNADSAPPQQRSE